MKKGKNNILILIPTYNEIENIEPLYSEIIKLRIRADILFVDDNSPDGSATLIRELAKKNTSIKLLTRPNKQGIGSAHLLGIDWAYKKGYSRLITMDCDFSHSPKDIKKFLKNAQKADIILGSRYLIKNSLADWNLLRKTLAFTGHFLTTRLLGMPYDATGAFRLYNLNKIPKEMFEIVESKGYSFFLESLFIFFLNDFSIKEVPIKLPARTYGHSKMTPKDALSSLKFLVKTYYLSKVYRDSYVYSPSTIRPNKFKQKIEKEWDEYWRQEKGKRKILYDTVAVFYRKFIIKRTLNSFVKKTFIQDSNLLHAGCGGGQVDTEVIKMAKITALDISSGALNRYKRMYGDSCRVMHGSILKIPSKSESYDGVYNLGVMEHFNRKDIKAILDEFNRVLKTNGKILLFWPPQFGLSVIFLNSAHFMLNRILGKNIRLHPHEITKVKSKKQIKSILKESGFKLKSFSFGPRDLFTYVVIIGEKTN